jgi:hypothetical protein
LYELYAFAALILTLVAIGWSVVDAIRDKPE